MKKITCLFVLLCFLLAGISGQSLHPYYASGVDFLKQGEFVYIMGIKLEEGSCYNTSSECFLLFNTRNNFRKFSCTVSLSAQTIPEKNYSFFFYVDGELVRTLTLKGGAKMEKVELELEYKKQLKIVLQDNAGRSKDMFLYDVDFK